MNLRVALQLGRVSNLPTVWTNVLTGTVLAGVAIGWPRVLALMLVGSLFYIGGMYLNDAFDAGIDARERPDRPIPSGAVALEVVWAAGFGMLGGALALLALLGAVMPGGTGAAPFGAGLALTGMILLYDAHHKANPLSPIIMGICRVLVYVMAALALSAVWTAELTWGCVALLSYLIGLTYVAKQETLNEVKNLWPLACLLVPLVYAPLVSFDWMTVLLVLALAAWMWRALGYLRDRAKRNIPHAVASLIAGIALLDATLIAAHGHAWLALVAVAGFVATLRFQRSIAGT